MSNLIQVRRGITADRLAVTPANGELVWDTTTQKLYCGDGTTAGGVAITSTGASGNISGAYDIEANTSYTDLGLSEEFEDGTLNPAWTATSGVATTVNFMGSAGADVRYDLTTRDKGMLVQNLTASSSEIRFRAATIGVGEQLVMSVSIPQSIFQSTGSSYVRLAVSDNTTSPLTSVYLALTMLIARSTGSVGIATSATAGESATNFLSGRRLYLRVIRTATDDFAMFYSTDGTTWSDAGKYSLTGIAYIWFCVGSVGYISGADPITSVNWIRHVAYSGALDPW